MPTALTFLYELCSFLDMTIATRQHIMYRVLRLLKNEATYSIEIIDQPPVAKTAALMLYVIENMV